jgi:hypothetical protein
MNAWRGVAALMYCLSVCLSVRPPVSSGQVLRGISEGREIGENTSRRNRNGGAGPIGEASNHCSD